jgi:hypothetical protein
MAQVNFKLMTPVQVIERQVFQLTDTTLLQSTNANPLVMGEWVQFDANFTLIRGDGTVPAFPVFDELGRSDTQAIGSVTCLITPGFIADTYVYDEDVSAPALGDALMVDTVSNSAVGTALTNKSGLNTHAASDLKVGYVLRTAAANNGYLRFLHTQA